MSSKRSKQRWHNNVSQENNVQLKERELKTTKRIKQTFSGERIPVPGDAIAHRLLWVGGGECRSPKTGLKMKNTNAILQKQNDKQVLKWLLIDVHKMADENTRLWIFNFVFNTVEYNLLLVFQCRSTPRMWSWLCPGFEPEKHDGWVWGGKTRDPASAGGSWSSQLTGWHRYLLVIYWDEVRQYPGLYHGDHHHGDLAQVEELTNLKKIAEKQLEEALESLQAEREQRYIIIIFFFFIFFFIVHFIMMLMVMLMIMMQNIWRKRLQN